MRPDAISSLQTPRVSTRRRDKNSPSLCDSLPASSHSAVALLNPRGNLAARIANGSASLQATIDDAGPVQMSNFRFMNWLRRAGVVAVGSSFGCSSSDVGPSSAIAGSGGAGASGDAAASGGSVDAAAGGSDAGGQAGMPITGLVPQSWNWVPFANAYCRDGSTTGIGVNPNPASTQLMIFLEGGGACFNSLTCSLNPQSFNDSDFATFASDANVGGGAGIFNRNDAANPVRDWNFVYVPYCTGDVHSGNNPNGSIPSLSAQKFVGYANMGLYLQRLVPTFSNVTQVLLTGMSAGGFGAAANYLQVAKSFGNLPVYLIDDSGPLMDSPCVPDCLAQIFVQTWGLDQTILADCGSDCSGTSHVLIDFMKHSVSTYPAAPMGLIDSTGDAVVSWFYGFGGSDCTEAAALTESTFAGCLQDMRTELAGDSNFGTFVFSGTDHTTLQTAATFDSRTSGTVTLTSWIAQLLGGSVTNVGP